MDKRLQQVLIALAGFMFIGSVFAVPEGPEPDTAEWGQREFDNFSKVNEAPGEQLGNPEFMQRLTEQGLANEMAWAERIAADPSWVDPRSANTQVTPLCTSWSSQCAGDPFRYPGVDSFYENEAEIEPILFYDRGCARISGHVWKPKGALDGDGLPAVVIENGSVQAPEPLYWWAAQLLVRSGYTVMTFDPRGQGRSDQQTPTGDQGSNANPVVFWDGLVDAIDFFRSSETKPYPHNETCAETYPTEMTAFNPYVAVADPGRLGLAGHSLGATGVSIVQGLDPWPGVIDASNPVDVIVAWDSLSSGATMGGPEVVPRVPAMGHSSEYGLTPVPFLEPPDPEGHKTAFAAWKDAGLPVYQITIQGSSHYEWSLIPTFPTTSWCPEIVEGNCTGGWGLPLAEHYTLAWFDRWMKLEGETGYDTADARLTADADWFERMSFYSRSARSFKDRSGTLLECEDIRGGMVDEVATPCPVYTSSTNGSGGGTGGGEPGNDSGGALTPTENTPEEEEGRFKGCSMGGASGVDPLLPVLLLLSIGMLWCRSLRSAAISK